ncbi:hypothetical protein N9997_01875 [Synechococcus sp. AH-603-L18]|nr:hypothetical protein [Synechococcus sp. AH-603-L18]MDB4338069.1 hypothetical protein [Synechococcus sp. AH-603-L18]
MSYNNYPNPNNFTRGFITAERGKTNDEYRQLAEEKGVHFVKVPASSFDEYIEDLNRIGEYPVGEEIDLWRDIYNNTIAPFGGSSYFNNDPEYDAWRYATDNYETVEGGEGTDKIDYRSSLTDQPEKLLNQKNINLRLMGGNDSIEVVDGVRNFVNGNKGDDNIVVKGGKGQYLGGRGNDVLDVSQSQPGSWVNGNQGDDIISGGAEKTGYRGGKDNDLLVVSQGDVWGGQGADTFRAVAGVGVAIVQDYTAGEDVVQGIAGGGFNLTEQGISYGVGDDQMLLLAGILDTTQVTLI